MREFAGRLVYDRMEEIAASQHTALLVVDMQNDFCHTDGVFGKNGEPVERIQSIVAGLAKFIKAARDAGVMVLFLRHTHEPDLANLSPARLSFYTRLYEGSDPYHVIRGTWGNRSSMSCGRNRASW